MDEYYDFFLKKFSPAFDHREAPGSSIAHYENKLPERLLEYWHEYGWGGYAEGLFWVANPQEYEGLLEHWLASTEFYLRDNYYVIARSAFGKLYVWGEKSGWCLTISPHAARYSGRVSKFTGDRLSFGVSVFFAFVRPEHNDLNGLFKPALEKLGQLNSDEMYGFVPALALGGAMELKNLQKVKAIEHLEFLSQLSPLQDWGFPEF
ncbi:GAD-like domain-containing protein [Pseudomonas fluorescens]|uniref:GAD-like domain-containing protein n=1 Tax=Pseudomonas fluorescens TaxID=294 RepID=UPI001784EEF4|nr:GAD-like domain-containing protein [Pseudomonas fluorescens]